ncbi:uncharacterized protein METZ01_LOCUS387402 [marine metagenome]|uniref:Uncharacterized protein n=1 Tax=marine metagenome TaxID=408172 RepID=A0A382ULH2_9ZZZZ
MLKLAGAEGASTPQTLRLRDRGEMSLWKDGATTDASDNYSK